MAKKDVVLSGQAGIEDYGYPFVWSTTEQIWPFERDSSDNVLYAKEVDFGALPNATTKDVAHGITNLNQIHEIKHIANNAGLTTWNELPGLGSAVLSLTIRATDIRVITTDDKTGYSLKVRLIYSKTV